ncbi:hypothetical protein OAK48_00210 [Deltaproteobacteria bacterium]|nr:hypothetical protein [Deltaproteobacteria bacterium]
MSTFTILQIYKNHNGLPEIVDVNHYIICLFIFYCMIMFYFTIIPLAVILASMSLGKGMFLFIALFIFLSVSLIMLLQRRYIQTSILFTSFISSWICTWLFFNQKLIYIDDFILNFFKFSEVYNQALSDNYFNTNLTTLCFVMAVISEIIILLKVRTYLRNKNNIAYLVTIIFEQFYTNYDYLVSMSKKSWNNYLD